MNLPLWRNWLPPTRQWWIVQCGILGFALVLAALPWCVAPPPEALASSPSGAQQIRSSLTNEQRAQLLERYPALPASDQEQREILAKLSATATELGLSLENRQVGVLRVDTFPKRRELTLSLSGNPARQVQFLYVVQNLAEPVRVTAVRWLVKPKQVEDVQLGLTLELFVASGS